MPEITFEYSYILILLVFPVALCIYSCLRLNKTVPTIESSEMLTPSHEKIKSIGSVLKILSFRLLPILRNFAIAAVIIAISKPNLTERNVETESYGVDMVIALDISSSMLADDFKPNRLTYAKSVVKDFIEQRQSDKMALVLFAGESYAATPLTLDKQALFSSLTLAKTGEIIDGTAIGMGVTSGLNLLKNSKSKSKLIILLTDGANNAGMVSPEDATGIAGEMGVKVYTIGIGSENLAGSNSTEASADTKLNETSLSYIANSTGAKYYRASIAGSLSRIMQEIDSNEKSVIKEKLHIRIIDLSPILVIIALLLLTIDFVIRYSYLKVV